MTTRIDFTTSASPESARAPLTTCDLSDDPSVTPGRRRIAKAASDRGKMLKYKADLGPVAYVLLMFALHMGLWWYASPTVALLSIVPLAITSMFIAPINHHHQHLNTFRSPLVNRFYDLILALQTGVAPYGWVLHHNLGTTSTI